MSILLNLNEPRTLPYPQPIPVDDFLPAKDRWVLLFTPSYRCLGYQDDGIWRDVAHGDRINDPVLAWMPLDESAAS